MKKSITIPFILQSVLTPEEVANVVQAVGYVDTARNFTVYYLLQHWCAAASEEWSGYRLGADRATHSGLIEVHYSCFSGKAADVPFAVFSSHGNDWCKARWTGMRIIRKPRLYYGDGPSLRQT